MKFIIVTARGPFSHDKMEGKDVIRYNVGGVATALRRLMKDSGGTWICWGDGSLDREHKIEEADGYNINRVIIDKREKHGFYEEYSNGTLWPLFHYFRDRVKFRSKSYEYYLGVNQKFADKVREIYTEGTVIWVHDYQLALLPGLIKDVIPDAFVVTTWHIPWVAGEFFSILPESREIYTSLTRSNLITFHTEGYTHNFINTQTEIPVDIPNIKRRVASIPLGIDEKYYSTIETRSHKKKDECKTLFSIDRLDYTKGLTNKVFAIEELLRKHPELTEKFSYVMFVTPSRASVKEYRDMKSELEMQIGRVNGKFGTVDWMPITYIHRRMTDDNLKHHYHNADIVLITPLMDGLNLVSKEFVAASENGILIISRFAGASHELKKALIVNPYSKKEIANSIYQALNMKPEEIKSRLTSLKRVVKKKDLNWWLERIQKEIVKRQRNARPTAKLVKAR